MQLLLDFECLSETQERLLNGQAGMIPRRSQQQGLGVVGVEEGGWQPFPTHLQLLHPCPMLLNQTLPHC